MAVGLRTRSTPSSCRTRKRAFDKLEELHTITFHGVQKLESFLNSWSLVLVGMVFLLADTMPSATGAPERPGLDDPLEGYGFLVPGGPDIVWPIIDAKRGRRLFASKGCVEQMPANRERQVLTIQRAA